MGREVHLQSPLRKQLPDTDRPHTAVLAPRLPLLLLGMEGGEDLKHFCSLSMTKDFILPRHTAYKAV